MSPVPQGDNLSGYYKTNYWLEHHRVSGTVRMNFDEGNVNDRSRSIYEWLKSSLHSYSKVLEIGSGFGHTLAYINYKSDANVFGVELSEDGTKNSVETYGISVFRGSWEEFVPKTQLFDIVIMSHVLEHFVDPDVALRKVAKNIVENGVLFVEVPNILKPNRRKNLKHWFSKEHISYFSKNKLEYLLSKSSFDILRVEEKHYLRVLARKQRKVDQSELLPEYKKVKTALLWHRFHYFIYRLKRKLRSI